MADDILASLGLDYSGYEQGLGVAAGIGLTFVQSQTAAFQSLVLPSLDTSTYVAGMQQAAAATQQAEQPTVSLAADIQQLSATSAGLYTLSAGLAQVAQQATSLGSFSDSISTAKDALNFLRAAGSDITSTLTALRADEDNAATGAADLALAIGQGQIAASTARDAIADLSAQILAYRTGVAEGAAVTQQQSQAAQAAQANLAELRGAYSSLNSAVTSGRGGLAEYVQGLRDTEGQSQAASSGLGGLMLIFRSTGAELGPLQPLLQSTTQNLGSLASGAQLSQTAIISLGAAAAAAAVGGIAALTNSFLDASDKVRIFAQMTGLTENTAQALGYAMSSVGANADMTRQALDFMARNAETLSNQLAQGREPTSQFALALEHLGVSSRTFIAEDADTRLRTLMDAFHNASPTIDKTALSMDVFSRGGAQMLPILSAGSSILDQWKAKMEAAGASVSGTQDIVLGFHSTTTELSLDMQAVANIVGSTTVPALSDLAKTADMGTAAFLRLASATRDLKADFDKLPGPIKNATEFIKEEVIANLPLMQQYQEAKDLLSIFASAEDKKATAQQAANVETEREFNQMQQNAAVLAAYTTQQQNAALAAGSNADALTKLQSAAQSANKTSADSAAFQDQWNRALIDGAKTGDEYDAVVAGLTEKLKSHDAFTKASAQSQLQLDEIVQHLGADVAASALAYDQATTAAAGLAAANQKLETAIESAGVQSRTFNEELAANSAAGSAAFAGAYGQAASSIAASLQQAFQASVTAEQAASAQFLQDQVALDQAWASDADAATIKVLEGRVSRDQAALTSAVNTANQRRDEENGYVSAVRDATTQIGTLETDRAHNTARLINQTVADEQAGLATRLTAENVLIDGIIALERKRLTETNMVQQAILAGEIALAQATLAQMQRVTDGAVAAADAQNRLQQDTLHNQNAAANAVTQLQGELFSNQLRLSHMTAAEQETDLASRLQAADATIGQLIGLEQQLAATTDPIAKQSLQNQIDALTVRKNAEQSLVSQSEQTAAANTRSITAETKAINLETAGVNELTAARKAGFELARQEEDVTKQVGASKLLVTQQQLDGLHQTTEADRSQAAADLAETNSALANYQALAAADAGVSTARVNNAKAAYNSTKELSDASVADFNDALSKESTAQTAFDSQQAASASATATLHTEGLRFADDETAAQQKLSLAMATGAGLLSAAQVHAAQNSIDAWHHADAVVLEDQRLLTQQLAPEDRKRLEAQLATDEGIRADAARTGNLLVEEASKSATAQAKATTDAARSIRDAGKQTEALRLADTQGTNGAAIASYAEMAQTVIGIQKQLAGPLSDADRARLEITLATDTQIRDDRQQTAQDGIKAENDYVSAYRSAEQSIISDAGKLFDLERQLARETPAERAAGLDQWLQAEISVVSQIQQLEIQLAQTTDAVQRASIQNQIAGLNILEAKYAELARQAEQNAKDMADAGGGGGFTSQVPDRPNFFAQQMAQTEADLAAGYQNVINTVTASAQAVDAGIKQAKDDLDSLTAAMTAPSTEQLGLQTQSDKLAIQIAQLEEAGAKSGDPRITRLEAEKKLLDDKAKAYSDETRATADLAKSQGLLDSGTTTAVAVQRSLLGVTQQLTADLTRRTEVEKSYYAQNGDQLAVWVKDNTSALDKVKGEIDLLTRAQKDAADQATRWKDIYDASLHDMITVSAGYAQGVGGSLKSVSTATSDLQTVQGEQTTAAKQGMSDQQAAAAAWRSDMVTEITKVQAAYDALKVDMASSGGPAHQSTPQEIHGTQTQPTEGVSIGIASYASGTDYVQQTGLAYIHQGERITSAEMNRVNQQPAPAALAAGPPAGLGGGSGPINLTINNTVNGSNLSQPQLEQAIENGGRKAARAALSEMLGRGATLAGRRVG